MNRDQSSVNFVTADGKAEVATTFSGGLGSSKNPPSAAKANSSNIH
jgi:hypothetical protein